MPIQAKSLLNKINHPIILHAGSITFLLLTAYMVLINEFLDGNSFRIFYIKRYQNYFFPEPAHGFLELPVRFWFGWSILGIFYKLIKSPKNEGFLFREFFLSGLIVHLFLILLSLQNDSLSGNYYWPIEDPFPLKSVYINTMVSILLIIIYIYTIKCFFGGYRSLGLFSNPIKYLPIIPLVFQLSFLINLQLMGAAVLILFIFDKYWDYTRSKLMISKINTRCVALVSLIFFIGILFRFINFNFIWNLNPDNICGLQGDGDTYCRMANNLLMGNEIAFSYQNFGYPYFLSLLLKITQSEMYFALLIQSLLCSTIPVVVYFITKKLINIRTALWAALFSAFSYNILYQSFVVGRAGLSGILFICVIFFLVNQPFEKYQRSIFVLGVLGGWLALVSAELIPIIFLCLVVKFKILIKRFFQGIFIFIFGFGLAQLPFQIVIFRYFDTIWPLGRTLGTMKHFWTVDSYSQWATEESKRLSERGVNFISDPIGALYVFLNDPITVLSLFVNKIKAEILTHIFDHQPYYLDPFFLQHETYFSGTLLFYCLFLLIVGAIRIYFGNEISKQNKTIIGIAVLYSFLFFSIVHSGWARFVAVIQPLYLIIIAFGFVKMTDWFFQRNNNINNHNVTILNINKNKLGFNLAEGNTNLILYRFVLFLSLFFLISFFVWNINNWKLVKFIPGNSFVRYKGEKIINYKGYYFYGRQLYKEKNYNEAVKAFEISGKSEGLYGNLYYENSNYLLGEIYFKLKKLKKSQYYYNEILNKAPNSRFVPYATSNLAAIYSKFGDFERSIEFSKKAIALKPDFAPSYYNLGNLFHLRNDFKKALNYYQHAVKLNPNFKEATFNLAYVQTQLGLLDKSEINYLKYISLDSGNAKAYFGLANVYALTDKNEKAIIFFTKAIKINPNIILAHLNLATLYLNSGKIEAALKSLENALDINSDNAVVHKKLGFIYARFKNDTKQAIYHFEKSLDLNKDQPEAAILKTVIKELQSIH